MFKNKKPELLSYLKSVPDGNLSGINFINKEKFIKSFRKLYDLGRLWGINEFNSLSTENNLSLNFNKASSSMLAETRAEKLTDLLENATKDFIENYLNKFDNIKDNLKQIEKDLVDDSLYALSMKRASLISDVEGRYAVNGSSADVWYNSDKVQKVFITDGDGCVICDRLDNTTQTLDWYKENLLEHPNCIRQGFPIINNAERFEDNA